MKLKFEVWPFDSQLRLKELKTWFHTLSRQTKVNREQWSCVWNIKENTEGFVLFFTMEAAVPLYTRETFRGFFTSLAYNRMEHEKVCPSCSDPLKRPNIVVILSLRSRKWTIRYWNMQLTHWKTIPLRDDSKSNISQTSQREAEHRIPAMPHLCSRWQYE